MTAVLAVPLQEVATDPQLLISVQNVDMAAEYTSMLG